MHDSIVKVRVWSIRRRNADAVTTHTGRILEKPSALIQDSTLASSECLDASDCARIFREKQTSNEAIACFINSSNHRSKRKREKLKQPFFVVVVVVVT
jgi:hypothetical protein